MMSGETFIPRGVPMARVNDLLAPQDTYNEVGGVIAMGKVIRRGEVLVQHRHAYAHLSVLATGTIILELDGQTKQLVGPCVIEVPANKHHGVKALTDAVWYCIHNSDRDVEVLDAQDLTGAREIAERLRGM